MDGVERKDWLLIVINAGRGSPLTPVQLQKSLFLLGQNYRQVLGAPFYDFVAYNYGPFSVEIYKDAEMLQTEGLVELRRDGRQWPEYALTRVGQEKAKVLRGQVPDNVSDYIEKVVPWTQSLSFPELVRAIYQAYPAFRANSVFQS